MPVHFACKSCIVNYNCYGCMGLNSNHEEDISACFVFDSLLGLLQALVLPKIPREKVRTLPLRRERERERERDATVLCNYASYKAIQVESICIYGFFFEKKNE
ncbi:unnamed protein product [Musa acuminata subsp. malaccensis]|uniref:(wild Malaysian banana) hypothetical protein n=1 Tax=Musa acuminata subsp. malaccensis TaxID=214687 RepID=A0A804KYW4_MUSAM|nr:unnamed protein product [Musa acuminata subsp. malaccensis]